MPVAVNSLTSKLKAQLKLSINRLRLVQQKETAIAKQQRRNLAQLLETGKEQSARIRVENIIREDLNVELLEILELYCELLLARIGLLEQSECDPGLEEAVKTIIYAAPRTEIKELHQTRELLIHKFSKEFAKSAIENSDNIIPEKVLKRLSTLPPHQDLVSLYLTEIAKAYNVPFSELDKSNDDDDDDDDAEGGVKQPVNEKIEPQVIAEVGEFPDPSAPPKSPISVVAPPPTTDNPHPTLKINTQTKFTTPQTPTKPNSEDKKLNDLDELTKRFEALRKR